MADESGPALAAPTSTTMLALPAAVVEAGGTPWFAVDRLGQIALFEPGDTGQIPPHAARLMPSRHALGRSFAPVLAQAGLLSYAAADLFEASADDLAASMVRELLAQTLLDAPPRFDQSHASVLVQLVPDAVAAGVLERLSQLGLVRLPSPEGDCAWGDLDSSSLRGLWREGWVRRAILGHALVPARMGLFEYGPDDAYGREADDDIYTRRDAPTIGLRVHALPTSHRSDVGAVVFEDLDFRVTTSLRASRAKTGDVLDRGDPPRTLRPPP